MRRAIGLLVGFVMVLPASGAVAAELRHSGTVTAVDRNAGTITLEEVGPWSPQSGGILTRTVRLRPGSHVVLVSRADPSVPHATPNDWPGGFRESPLDAADVRPGDFVTVTVTDDGGQAVAQMVAVVRTDAESASIR
jgi:hypothetical protein